MSEPQPQHSNAIGYVVVAIFTGGANALSWAQSFSAGLIATGITIVGGGLIGFIVLFLQKVGPAWVDYKTYRDVKRDGTLSGKLDKLAEALDAEREGKEIARQVAASAKELADVNLRLLNRANEQIARLADEFKASREENAALAKRLEDANQKLHDQANALQVLQSNTELAVQGQDDLLRRIDRNANLTIKVDGKAEHIIEGVDALARKSGDDLPAIGGGH